jgi:hypothetical protein
MEEPTAIISGIQMSRAQDYDSHVHGRFITDRPTGFPKVPDRRIMKGTFC